MKKAFLLAICALALSVGVAACGKQPVANVNTNANTNGNENVNAELPNVNGDANANANIDLNTNANTNINTDTDFDDDGLTNDQEREYKTDPLNPDTDGDGYTDGDEVRTGYDPTKIPSEDPKVISQLRPVNTPGVPAPIVRNVPLKAVQSFPFRVRRDEGGVTLRFESKTALANANVVVDFAGGEENHGPSFVLDSKYNLLRGGYDKGKVWGVLKDFTKGAHFAATANISGTMTVYPAPTPPFSISATGDGGVEDSGLTYDHQFIADFPKSGSYIFELGITKGKVKVSMENTNLTIGDKVYQAYEAISTTKIKADVTEGLHVINLQAIGLTSWSLRVSKG